MFCPVCGQEYREGIARCAECDAVLVRERPSPASGEHVEWSEFETVLETTDPALIAVAKSLLEAEGIPCSTSGDLIQDLVGLGRFPTGGNLATGPVRLMVPLERSAEARELLDASHLHVLDGDGANEGEQG